MLAQLQVAQGQVVAGQDVVEATEAVENRRRVDGLIDLLARRAVRTQLGVQLRPPRLGRVVLRDNVGP